MWQYSEILMDHFMNPRNVGNLENPDGHSEVGSPQCGDAMFLDIDIDDEGRIAEIAFKTFGCAGAIASASALTELAKGELIKDALSIKNSQIADYLGGMPPEKFHCSVMGHQALKQAVEDFESKCKEISVLLDEAGVAYSLVRPGKVIVELQEDINKVKDLIKEKLEKEVLVEVK